MTDVAGQARRGWQAGQGTASRRGFERKARAEGSRICTEERAMREFPPAAGALFAFALFSSPEAHEWYWFARGGAGYTWERAG